MHLTHNDPVEYAQLVGAIEKGFKTHYRMDPEDLAYLREKFQDSKRDATGLLRLTRTHSNREADAT